MINNELSHIQLEQYINMEIQKQPSKTYEVEVDTDAVTPLMTINNLKHYCILDGLPQRPELNQKLYLYQKGFKKILSIRQYQNLTSLWLNKNKIARIQNLEGLNKLVCLYLGDNLIEKIQGLESLQDLQILNLERNRIKKIQNLGCLLKIQNLNMSQNLLTDADSIEELTTITKLGTLDLSKNQIQNTKEVYQVIAKLKGLSYLLLKSTNFARGLMNYRKNIIAILPNLKFFDDRPVLETQHRICQAWLIGGPEKQKTERARIMNEQKQKTKQKIAQPEEQLNYGSSNFKMQQKPIIPIQNFKNISTDTNIQKKVSQESNKKTQLQTLQQPGQQNQEIQQASGIEENKQERGMGEIGWKKEYEPLLQVLLQKYEFDFPEVQPRLNMIITGINKKLMRPTNRFEVRQLQKIWTQVEIRRRLPNKL